MKWEIVLWAVFFVMGVVASFWNWGHIYFTALPSGLLALASAAEYRQEKKRQARRRHETLS